MMRHLYLALMVAIMAIVPHPLTAQTKATKSTQKEQVEKKKKKEKKAADKKTSASKKASTAKEKAAADKKKASSTKGKKSQKKKTLKEKVQEVKENIAEKVQEAKENVAEKVQEAKENIAEKSEIAMFKADSVLDVRNAKITTDTMWVARPAETWTFRAKSDMMGDIIHLRAVDRDGDRTSYHLANDPKMTLGIMANYRGVSLSLSLSPTKLLSDLSDMASAINYYSNTIGFDVNFEKIESFRGRNGTESHRHRLYGTNLREFTASGYYVFNGKKFSYPAVFNSTWVQKRSAGSFLVQANFATGRLKFGDNTTMEQNFDGLLTRIDMSSISIGGGYGYNYVPNKHWLLHITAQPSLMVWKNYKLHLVDSNGTETKEKMPSSQLNLFVVGRLGAIYSWNRYFIGLTSVVQTAKTGKNDDFALTDTKWQGRAFFGWRVNTQRKTHLNKKGRNARRHGAAKKGTTARKGTTSKTSSAAKKGTAAKKTATKK